jgi:hypothetical protein
MLVSPVLKRLRLLARIVSDSLQCSNTKLLYTSVTLGSLGASRKYVNVIIVVCNTADGCTYTAHALTSDVETPMHLGQPQLYTEPLKIRRNAMIGLWLV